jgi:hypothetical protein
MAMSVVTGSISIILQRTLRRRRPTELFVVATHGLTIGMPAIQTSFAQPLHWPGGNGLSPIRPGVQSESAGA